MGKHTQTETLNLMEDYAPCRIWTIRDGFAHSGQAIKAVTSIKRVNEFYYIVNLNGDGDQMMVRN